MIYVILFFLSELCDSYCIYRLIRGLSGECRVKHVWEALCYPVYGLVTGTVYLLWNLPLLTMASSMIVLFALTMLYDGKLSFLREYQMYRFRFCNPRLQCILNPEPLRLQGRSKRFLQDLH